MIVLIKIAEAIIEGESLDGEINDGLMYLGTDRPAVGYRAYRSRYETCVHYNAFQLNNHVSRKKI